jgi:hypothetical protein
MWTPAAPWPAPTLYDVTSWNQPAGKYSICPGITERKKISSRPAVHLDSRAFDARAAHTGFNVADGLLCLQEIGKGLSQRALFHVQIHLKSATATGMGALAGAAAEQELATVPWQRPGRA